MVARTFADIEGREQIVSDHVFEAIQDRGLDREANLGPNNNLTNTGILKYYKPHLQRCDADTGISSACGQAIIKVLSSDAVDRGSLTIKTFARVNRSGPAIHRVKVFFSDMYRGQRWTDK
jgi:hypothetical protein